MKKNFCICEKPIKHIKDESRPDLFGCARCGKPSENQLAEKQQDGWDVMMAASKVTYAGADRPRKFAKKLAEMIKEAMSRPFPDEAKASPQPIDLRYFRPDGEKIIVEQKPQAKSPTDDPVFSSRALWPKDVSTVQEPAVDVAHFSDISINCNLGREELFEQGRSGPYHRYLAFPVCHAESYENGIAQQIKWPENRLQFIKALANVIESGRARRFTLNGTKIVKVDDICPQNTCLNTVEASFLICGDPCLITDQNLTVIAWGPSCIGGVIVANMNCDLPEKIEVF